MRAALEAMAHQVADIVDVLPVAAGVLRADGGATANGFLMQLQADLIGVPVEVSADADATALGAAALAGLAVGIWPDVDALVPLLRRGTRYEPSLDAGDIEQAPRELAACGPPGDPAPVTWVIAHRGASSEEKENTLPAFERAIELGADYVEFDVQASSDGGLVVFHDLRLDRLTDANAGRCGRDPLAALRELGIPTLAEVLELTSGRIGVMAELKSPWLYRRHDIVARTVDLLPADGVVVSFSRRAILETAAAAACASDRPARGLRDVDPSRGRVRLGGRLRRSARDAPRDREGAAARARDDSSTRSTTRPGCWSSRRSACPGSSRIIRVEHWQPLAVLRQAEQLRVVGGDPRHDLRPDRQRRGAGSRHVGRPGSCPLRRP